MSYKPADLFVGVIDFFAVLLPGALVVAVALPVLPDAFYGDQGIVRPVQGAAAWIAFLFAAYLAGHLLFLVGALLDSSLYDPLRRTTVRASADKAFDVAKKLRNEALGSDAEAINTFQWARASLRLRMPAAIAEVERYEADSKFFRGLAVALYVLLAIFSRPGPALALALSLPLVLVAAGVWDAARSVRSGNSEGKSSRGGGERWVAGLLAAVFLALLSVLAATRDWRGLFLLVLLGLCIWRYAERRWKSTRSAYYYAMILERSPREEKIGPPTLRAAG